jgi:hypothetical protein
VILRNPFAQPLSFVALEIVVLACGAATFVHAWRAWRRGGELLPLFTWIAIVSYGVAMEIVSYSTVDNFTHGPFTVMLYRGKLPLYVVAVYPALLYTGIAAVRRLGLPRWAEPLVCGLAIVLLDVPFDVLGPDAGWWSWSPTDPNVRVRWEGVPLTSYYWHIAFGACLALLTRSVDRWLARPSAAKLALAPVLGAMTIVLGGLSFIPFHVLQGLGVSDGANLALLVTACLGALAFARRGAAGPRDPLVFAIPVALHALFLGVLLARGAVTDAADKAVIVLVGSACSLALHAYAQLRGLARPARAEEALGLTPR